MPPTINAVSHFMLSPPGVARIPFGDPGNWSHRLAGSMAVGKRAKKASIGPIANPCKC
jgi:hypothetical protein